VAFGIEARPLMGVTSPDGNLTTNTLFGPELVEQKLCYGCKIYKPLEDFHRSGRGKRSPRCRLCSEVPLGKQAVQAVLVGVKWCNVCGKTKSRSEFWTDNKTTDGLHCSCKACANAKAMDYYRNSWLSYVVRQAKHRAKKSGVPFDISPSDIVIPTHCPILGVRLEIARDISKSLRLKDNSPSLDRKVPEKGYVVGNVFVISMLANRIKTDCTDPTVFDRVAAYIRSSSS
jgi:hypothetical protein